MANKTDYAENLVINALLRNTTFTPPAAVYAGLFTVSPTSDAGTGGTEVSGGSYARQAITFSAPSAGSTSNSSALLFPAATAAWGTIVAAGIWDAATGGNLLYFDPISPSVVVNNGDQFQFKIGNFSVTED